MMPPRRPLRRWPLRPSIRITLLPKSGREDVRKPIGPSLLNNVANRQRKLRRRQADLIGAGLRCDRSLNCLDPLQAALWKSSHNGNGPFIDVEAFGREFGGETDRFRIFDLFWLDAFELQQGCDQVIERGRVRIDEPSDRSLALPPPRSRTSLLNLSTNIWQVGRRSQPLA